MVIRWGIKRERERERDSNLREKIPPGIVIIAVSYPSIRCPALQSFHSHQTMASGLVSLPYHSSRRGKEVNDDESRTESLMERKGERKKGKSLFFFLCLLLPTIWFNCHKTSSVLHHYYFMWCRQNSFVSFFKQTQNHEIGFSLFDPKPDQWSKTRTWLPLNLIHGSLLSVTSSKIR